MSSLPDAYRSVKLERGELVDRIKNTTQSEWIKACCVLGLFVLDGSGRGSHIAVYKSNTCPPEDSTCLVLTIVQKPFANIQRDYVKKVVYHGIECGRYTEDDVWRALGVLPRKKGGGKSQQD
jgi:hypothetical protein